ncbi:tRNA lysidine(34) synthetase TilS [Castellaniella sp.]|uniref:tRNA lysidine(34) synthetase TilS n=1 Tax=Castellaniella sp. TaxID=1955812 RepID=UPI002AFDFE49|nr:tRNA lysidine(34) synthetase TilS [Castellaniella sp.]
MGASRKRADHPAVTRWRAACDDDLLAAVRGALAGLPADAAIGVALSGGADSAMLALHAAAAADGRPLHCFHIHHGLQQAADDWLQHAHRLSGLLGASCHSRRVQVVIQGDGMEAAARAARYAALADLAAHAGVACMLLAHHQDDQAETVLLRLLRGAGPLGLTAMLPVMQRQGVTYRRPWLDQARDRILQAAEQFAALSGWHAVQDPSNQDARYKRAALRQDLAPVLDAYWPAWRRTLGRHARQAQDLAQWAQDAAHQDWRGLDPQDADASFSLAAWRALPAVRQAPVLRFWLQDQGLLMPTEARLDDWLRQLREVHALGHDRQVRLRHEKHWIVVQKGRVRLVSGLSDENIRKTQLE